MDASITLVVLVTLIFALLGTVCGVLVAGDLAAPSGAIA
jgi:cbb3-type cytochrome oxidase subunit 1